MSQARGILVVEKAQKTAVTQIDEAQTFIGLFMESPKWSELKAQLMSKDLTTSTLPPSGGIDDTGSKYLVKVGTI